MKIYGKRMYRHKPTLLKEVTFVVTPEEIADLIRFLSFCTVDMASNPDWEHVHLQDFMKEKNIEVDVVVLAANK